jgi:hypothetical protein
VKALCTEGKERRKSVNKGLVDRKRVRERKRERERKWERVRER